MSKKKKKPNNKKPNKGKGGHAKNNANRKQNAVNNKSAGASAKAVNNKNAAKSVKTEKGEKVADGGRKKTAALIVCAALFTVLLAVLLFCAEHYGWLDGGNGETGVSTSRSSLTSSPATAAPTEPLTETVTEAVTDAVTEVVTEATTAAPTLPPVTVPATAAAAEYGDYIVNVHVRPSYTVLCDEIRALCNRYPSLLTSSVIGQSVRGRDITLMRMGTGSRTALVTAGIHAREYMTVNYLLYCIENYCKAYSAGESYGGYDMNALFSEYTLYIVPNINPDGTEISIGNENPLVSVEGLRRTSYKANANGVDLNRNFPLGWSSVDNNVYAPANYYFKGYSEASEPETQCMINLCRSNSFEFMLSFHVAGECVYWGDTFNTVYNSQFRAFAQKITDPTGFRLLEPSYDINSYGGGFENWFRYEFSRPGFCVELMDKDKLEYPVTDSALQNFESAVRWKVTKYIIPEAMTD